MKLNKFIALGASAALAFATTQSAFAHEGEEHAAIPETADGILQEIHKHHGELDATVKSKNLKEVHEHAEAITALAKALPDKVTAEKKDRVQGSANNIAKVADTLHDASDAGDQAKTEAELKKLDGVLMALDKQVK
jgi:hypothetical protein